MQFAPFVVAICIASYSYCVCFGVRVDDIFDTPELLFPQSQGMTIPLLEVSFNNVFEYGQGYVALSRATCLEGLTLRSFQVHFKSHLNQ